MDERSEGVFEEGRLGCPHCGGSGRENQLGIARDPRSPQLAGPYAYRGRYTEPKQELPRGEARALLTRACYELD